MSARQIDTNGWIEIKNNPISRCGIFQYLGASIPLSGLEPDRMYNVYRAPEELNNPETIESFKLLPWINDHAMIGPKEDLAAEKKGISGVTGEDVYFEHPYLLSNIKVFSQTMADDILRNEKKDLSPGFHCLWFKENGVYNGEEYQIVQREIRGNHLALVVEGRSGPDVSVLDQKENEVPMKEKELPGAEVVKDEESGVSLASLKPILEEILSKLSALIGAEKAEVQDEEPAKKEEEPAKKEEKAEDNYKAMDAIDLRKSIYVEMSRKNALAERLSREIGTFDHSEWSLDEVARYGVKELKLLCPKGHEATILSGYLAGKKVSTTAANEGAVVDAKPKIDAVLSYGQPGV